MVWYGMVWYGMVCYGMVWCNWPRQHMTSRTWKVRLAASNTQSNMQYSTSLLVSWTIDHRINQQQYHCYLVMSATPVHRMARAKRTEQARGRWCGTLLSCPTRISWKGVCICQLIVIMANEHKKLMLTMVGCLNMYLGRDDNAPCSGGAENADPQLTEIVRHRLHPLPLH